MADVAWNHGSLVTPATPAEPAGLGQDDSIAALLDAAEDIVNAAGPGIKADVEAQRLAEQERANRSGIRRFFDRRKKRD